MRRVVAEQTYREWSELTEEEKAVHRFHYSQSSLCRCLADVASDEVTSYFTSRLQKLGLPHDDISWSLSNCQGDGVAFYGKVELTEQLLSLLMSRQGVQSDRFTVLRSLLSKQIYSVSYILSPNSYGHRYSHANCIECEVLEVSGGDTSRLSGIGGTSRKVEAAVYELSVVLLAYVKDLCVEFENEGYRLLEESISEEGIREFCEVNDIMFDSNNDVCWHWSDSVESKALSPVFVVTVEGGVLTDAVSNMPGQLLVIDNDAEVMDPQGFPEVGLLSVAASADAVKTAFDLYATQEAFRAEE